ncbi:probable G-protein coupled receptor 179, partial [Micropterus salmoides]|uniref:probable G-protein coupled receptor 179 n=1 Tax=Micropterus salmoides TaxID=27706 RepID=UPI0018EDE86C
VFIMYFKPSTFRCILLRWVRMLGFSIVYGTVTLKMYRVLKVFLSRTAQRVPYMSSLHLLRILGVMLMTVSWFLCAWTVGVLQNRDRNIPVFITMTTSDGQGFNLCYLDRWDYMMAVAELLFLCWGSSLWTAVRPVPSAFHEPRYMGIAIHNELLLSTMFHLFRFTFPSLHPDWMLLLSFTHTHVTITVTLALLFIPKFLYVSKPVREEIAAEVYEDEVDLRRSGSYLNSSFHSAWSEHSVDPDDFRDELKKLYAQLEVHKTKKMTANNPHLSKKRSSRCALGRSIIRRIAEIPETMSRQCSREEKDGSFHSRSVNLSESFRRAPDTVSVSISYRSSVRTPSPSMRKSQSDHHYVRERDSSLRDSMLKANAVKRSSRRSETDSLDIPPGVCKSASAQNLTIDTNLLHPDHTKLHKSWSLTSTTAHSMENIAKVNRASTVLTRSRQSISISDQTRSALKSESFDKAEVCPWDVEQEQSGDKNQKHVTYANSENCEQKRAISPEALICPWDHLPPVDKNPSEDKATKGETESPKPQLTVSASAPGTPRPKVTKDQRIFSFRTTTTKWLSVKSIMGSMDAGSKEGSLHKEDSVSQKSQESASTTPRSGTSSRRPSIEKRSLQKRSMTTDGKPCLVKQNAIRLSSGDSTDRSPRRLVIVKSAVYPWDMEDMQKDGTYENVFLSRQNSKRSSISSWETASSCRTPSTRRRGSYRRTPTRNVSYADVCPWDGTGTSGTFQEEEGSKKQQSIKADVCPWESQVSEPSNVCPWESQEPGDVRRRGSTHSNVCPWESQEQDKAKRRGSAHSNVCPWESQDVPIIYHSKPSIDSQTQQSLKRAADICPWQTAETPQPSIRQENEYSNVCPWDVQDKPDVVYENLSPLETKGTLTVPFRQEVMKPAVYTAASKEQSLSNEQKYNAKSPALHLGRQVTKTTESCPWDFPDPPKTMENICPWEESNTEPTNTNTISQMIIKVDICPWETGHQDKPEDSLQGVLPLKAASIQTEGKDGTRVNICPWETEPPEKSAASKMGSQGLERLADVCPWDSSEPESGKSEIPKTSESHIRQDTARADVCPWETEAPKVLKKQDSALADVCPWETEEPKVLKKQDSTLADVCPWETEEPGVVKKQDSTGADICPWDSKDPQTSTQSQADIPNTDKDEVIENQEPLNVEDTPADICTEQMESKENLALGRRDALCPWEMVRSRSGSFTDNASDIFTWEPENIPEEDEEDDAECAAEALVFPPDL